MAPGQPFRPHMHAQPQPQQQQKYQAYVMGPNGRYVGMQQQQLAQQQQQPPPLPPPQHRQRDPLTAAIRGTTVDHTDLKDAITHINLTRKEETDAKFLRHALQSLPQLDGVSPSQLDRIISAMEPFFLKPRETAIRHGDPSDFLFVLQGGRLQLGGPNLGPGKLVMPGEIFGVEALDCGDPSDYTAFASGMCQLWRLHRRHFKLLQKDYGARLRGLFQTVIDQTRERNAQQRSAMMNIVATAMERKREAELLNKSLVWQEFPDVKSTIEILTMLPGSLGKGAFGEVRLCRHPNGKAYALKTQQAHGPKVPERARTNIDREIACMREGGSPFLMRFFGEYEEEGISRMLLEYLGGGSLEQLMGGREKMQPLPPPHCLFYFACVCSAFDAMHTAGWMHRDLSLKNVMVDNHGYGKLIDVGLAKKVKDGEHTYTLCGTPIYYAPELIKGTGYGHKAEIWALGVLFHELLSGTVPFLPPANSPKKGNERRLELYNLINKSEPTFAAKPFSGPSAAKDTIVRCLRKKPSERCSIPEIRTSALYHGFDWDTFHLKRMQAPFVPAANPIL